jgi:hypothetical protein
MIYLLYGLLALVPILNVWLYVEYDRYLIEIKEKSGGDL